MRLEHDKSLRLLNTFGIEVAAKHYSEIATVDDFRALVAEPRCRNEPRLVLGGGSNILFTRDFDGLVVKNSLPGIAIVNEDAAHVWVRAAAGEAWHALVMFCVERRLGGLENLALIPGQVGAAPIQNIGAYGVEMGAACAEVAAVHAATGEAVTFTNAECEFGYRQSVFKHRHRGQFLITAVTFRLDKAPRLALDHPDIRRTLDEMGVTQPCVDTVTAAVIRIRSARLPDPKVLGNAGSFFQNPVIPPAHFARLVARHAAMPHYPQPNGNVKLPAGWLIEQCGWKGKKVGRAGVHAQHALVLVNLGGATGAEIHRLAMAIQDSVRAEFGIDLAPEVNLI